MHSLSEFAKVFRPIKRRLQLMLARAIVELVDNDEGTMKLQITVLSGEVLDGIERFEEYGLSSYPKTNSEAFVAFLNGSRDQGIIIKVHDRRYRPNDLDEGDACLHTDQDNHRIWLKSNGKEIYIEGDKLELQIDGDVEFSISGDINATVSGEAEISAEQVTLKGTTKLNLESDVAVNLGGEGGQGVARIGDTVAGGVITTGSVKVKST